MLTRALLCSARAECKVADGDTTAMHLIIKALTAKPENAPSGTDDKAPKCSCVIS